MSVNLLQPGVVSAPLSVKAPSAGGKFMLDISRISSLTTEGVWLKDLKTGTLTDLSGQDTFSYPFDLEPGDNPDRFMVYFKTPTALDDITASYLSCYYSNGELVIKGLQEQDINSLVSIVDMSGRIIQKTIIVNYPEMRIPVNISNGVYVAKITGKRSATLKFLTHDNF